MTQSRPVNPKETVVALNATGGAYVLISASKFCRYVEIVECAPNAAAWDGTNFAPQGLNYQLPDDAYTATFALLPAQTLSLGDTSFARDKAYGVPAMTDPAGGSIPATPFAKLKSATATTTQVLVREWS